MTNGDDAESAKHFGDRIRLYCQSCRADLHIDLILDPVGDYGKSLAVETSAIGTAAFVSTRFFRCGTCFIKFMQNRSRKGQKSNPDPQTIPIGEAWKGRRA